jgi:ABC-type nitrate/sulfonate/bicarbonate transport system permease component
MRNKSIYILLGIVLIVTWQYFGSTNSTVRLLLSSPSLLIDYFSVNYADLLLATKTTLIEAVAGLLLATVFSFSIMILCFYYPKFMDFVLPIMVTSQVIPLIVLAPFFIILLGIGIWSKIAMAALLCFFPIFVNFAQGYKAINQNIHELMHIYNADTWTKIKKVYFPLSMPSIIAGLKISANLAVIGAIVAEFTGANNGLGKNLFISALRLEPELMISSLLLSILIGISLFLIISLLENKILNW